MLSVLAFYASIAIITSVIAIILRKQWMLELFIANMVLGSIAAWVGGVLFGVTGPVVAGLSFVACLGFAMPAVLLFNLLFAPARETERIPPSTSSKRKSDENRLIKTGHEH